MSTRARRLVALEARLRQVDGDELRELLRVMSYGELLALEAAVVPHGDVGPALQAGDEVTIALIAAARARRQGHQVAPLFNEPARRYIRTPHPTRPHDRASLVHVPYVQGALDAHIWRPEPWYVAWYAEHGGALAAELTTAELDRLAR